MRVAAHVATYLRFDAPIDSASVELDGRAARFHWVDVGERLVVVEPSGDLGARERRMLRVRYKDGASPAVATLVLVTHPTRVDKEVEVVRRPRPLEALEAALAEKEAELAALKARYGAGGPAGLVVSGRIDKEGVRARPLEQVPSALERGLKVNEGWSYRGGPWALVIVRVRNLPGQPPWVPASASLTRADGTPVPVRSVELDKAPLAPGEEGLVTVELEAPAGLAGQVFRVEVLDTSGVRHLPIFKVRL